MVVRQVLARNPSVAEMEAAWHAASARYPQVRSLDDPMFAATVGPDTIAADDPGVRFAYRLEISQKLPYPGKRRLRGENALAEASAVGRSVEDMRLQVAESARMAFYDYYLAERALGVNEEGLKLLQEFRRNARSRYQTGLVPEQDVLQADVEIGRQRDRRLALEEARRIAVARLNTLLHLPTSHFLPPPPARLHVADGLPDVTTLQAAAVAHRPDLQAVRDRITAEQASVGLAHKDFCPDFEPFFMYDRFMGNIPENRDLAPMLGVRLNLPVYRAKRWAAVAEVEARLAQRHAELARQSDQVALQVAEAYERVVTSRRSVRLYEETILRSAGANVRAAQAAYVNAKIPLLSLIEAQRSYVDLSDRYYGAIADYFRRLATLERAAGGPLAESTPSVGPASDGA